MDGRGKNSSRTDGGADGGKNPPIFSYATQMIQKTTFETGEMLLKCLKRYLNVEPSLFLLEL